MVLGHHQNQQQQQQLDAQPTTSVGSTTGPAPTVVDGEHAHGLAHPNQSLQQETPRTDGMAPTRGQGGLGGHRKFTFGRFLRLWGVDLITMACMGAVGLGVYEASPAPSRSFPVYFADGEIVYPQFAYPLRNNIIPIYAAALLAFFVPFVFFVLFQIRRRSWLDLISTTMGLLSSLITAAVFQVFVKWLIGGLRPHFLTVCAPSITPALAGTGTGFGGIMFDRSICTGDENEINDSLESMPSGHSTAAGAGFVYLALYFNAQLKVFSDHNPAYWKHIIFFAPLLGAVLIAGSLTIDEYHHYYDVLAGLLIGTACAFSAFRMVFASVWDHRFSHILLPREESLFLRRPTEGTRRFDYALNSLPPPATAVANGEKHHHLAHHSHGAGAAGGLRARGVDSPFTREGGWGPGAAAVVGAPGDALTQGGGLGHGQELGEQRGAGYV